MVKNGDEPPASAPWGHCDRDYPRAAIVSPYRFETARAHYEALLAETRARGGPTEHTYATVPGEWNGRYIWPRGQNWYAELFWNQMPTILSLLWFGVFGGAALQEELQTANSIAGAVQQDAALAIYALLEHYPLSAVTGVLAMLLVTVFFITSSDSGSFVVDMLSSGGNPDPPVWQRIFWATLEGILAILLLAIGGLDALQAGVVSLGLPFCLILLATCWCLYQRLKCETPGR